MRRNTKSLQDMEFGGGLLLLVHLQHHPWEAGVPIAHQMETTPRNDVLPSKQNTFLYKILMESTHSAGKILFQLSLIFQIKNKKKKPQLGNLAAVATFGNIWFPSAM